MSRRRHRRYPEVEAVLAVGSFLLFSVVGLILMFQSVPASNEKYALAVLVALIGIVKDTFGRYFQATKGSQEQRVEAAQVAKKLADTAAVVATKDAAGTVTATPPPGGTATATAAP